MPIRVTLYARANCHLCDHAEGLLRRAAPDFGFEVDVVDIESNDELHRRYLFEIPVVAVDGAVLMRAPIDEHRLRTALAEALSH
jgi:hypothetical protein